MEHSVRAYEPKWIVSDATTTPGVLVFEWTIRVPIHTSGTLTNDRDEPSLLSSKRSTDTPDAYERACSYAHTVADDAAYLLCKLAATSPVRSEARSDDDESTYSCCNDDNEYTYICETVSHIVNGFSWIRVTLYARKSMFEPSWSYSRFKRAIGRRMCATFGLIIRRVTAETWLCAE